MQWSVRGKLGAINGEEIGGGTAELGAQTLASLVHTSLTGAKITTLFGSHSQTVADFTAL